MRDGGRMGAELLLMLMNAVAIFIFMSMTAVSLGKFCINTSRAWRELETGEGDGGYLASFKAGEGLGMFAVGMFASVAIFFLICG